MQDTNSRTVRILTKSELPSASDREKVRGRAVLILLAQSGHCVQEVLKPAQQLEAAGCEVVFASLDGGEVHFDPLCNMLAQLEIPWDPTVRLMRLAKRQGRLAGLRSLRELASQGQLESWHSRFDAIVVPGGHGETFAAFIREALVIGTVGQFLKSGRVAALMCHAVVLVALLECHGAGAVQGRTVTCWPRAYEKIQRCLPVLGRYLTPFGWPVGTQLELEGGKVLDHIRPGHRVHAVIDGNLVTGRGPWSTNAFVTGVISALSATPRRVAAASEAPGASTMCLRDRMQ